MILGPKKEPFYEVEYKEHEGSLCPILEIIIGEDKKEISAYADTGCTTGIFVFKEQIKDIDLGTKINDEPSPCVMADGHRIGADEYVTIACINGEKRPILVTVLDPTIKLGRVSPKKMMPLLGRNFLDTFDVLFKGKKRKIALFHAE